MIETFQLTKGLTNFMTYDEDNRVVTIDYKLVTKYDIGINVLTFNFKDEIGSEGV